MSVYKEGFHAIQLIEKNSRQIWNDAADFGAPVKKGDNIWNWTKQLVEWYGIEGSRIVDVYLTGTTVTQRVLLMNESTGKRSTYEVAYVTTRSSEFDGYVVVSKLI